MNKFDDLLVKSFDQLKEMIKGPFIIIGVLALVVIGFYPFWGLGLVIMAFSNDWPTANTHLIVYLVVNVLFFSWSCGD